MAQTGVLDTSVLTDVLLKSATRGATVREALSRFTRTVTPGYAIKEFVSGPLKYFIWIHNRLVTEKSLEAVLDWLHRLSRTPQRYATSTAIEALRETAARIAKHHIEGIVEKYGARASLSVVIQDQIRLSLRTTILMAWSQLRTVTNAIVDVPGCYGREELIESDGLLLVIDGRCSTRNCHLWPEVADRCSLDALIAAVEGTAPSRERQRRAAALSKLSADTAHMITERECRALGDVMIALSGPSDATLVTSNVRDFEPLCRAVGKSLLNPFVS